MCSEVSWSVVLIYCIYFDFALGFVLVLISPFLYSTKQPGLVIDCLQQVWKMGYKIPQTKWRKIKVFAMITMSQSMSGWLEWNKFQTPSNIHIAGFYLVVHLVELYSLSENDWTHKPLGPTIQWSKLEENVIFMIYFSLGCINENTSPNFFQTLFKKCKMQVYVFTST